MNIELIQTGYTYDDGRIAINNAFSGQASFNVFSASTMISGSTDLYNIFLTTADGNDITRVQPGTNISTGGTANNPTVSLVDSPSVSNFTASGNTSLQTVSATTFVSGSTNLYNIFSTISSSAQVNWQSGSTGSFSIKATNTSGLDAIGDYSIAYGNNTLATGNTSHAEGRDTRAFGGYSHSEGKGSLASGSSSHAEGESTIANGINSHVEGYYSTAIGLYSHTEGASGITYGVAAHCEGGYNTASGDSSHAEGLNCISNGHVSHVEGSGTTANGKTSHSEGSFTVANGIGSHVEGFYNTTEGVFSHATGRYNYTIAPYSQIFGGSGNTLTANAVGSVMLGCSGSTGNMGYTTYVNNLNIKLIGAGIPITKLGVDADGYVVSGGSTPSFITLTYAATTYWGYDLGSNAEVTLNGNTILSITGVSDGDYGTIIVTQDGPGNRSLSFGASPNKVVNGGGGTVLLTSTGGAVDILSFVYRGSTFYWTVGYNYS